MGEGRSGTLALRAAQMNSRNATPTTGSRKRTIRSPILCSLSSAVDGKRQRILLGLIGVESTVEELDGFHILRLGSYTHILHGFEVNILPDDFLRDSCVVQRFLHHAPPAELREPPVPITPQRVVAIAIIEDHVV